MAEKKFTDGLVVIQPREGAPDFVKGRLSFKVETFIKFLKENTKEDGWCNVDILQSKAGDKWYGVLNNWKPERKEEPKADAVIEYPREDIDPNLIPF